MTGNVRRNLAIATLILLQHRDTPPPSARGLLAACAPFGPATLLLTGTEPVAEGWRWLPGVERILHAPLAGFPDAGACAMLAEIAAAHDPVFSLADAFGRDVIPRLAALLDAPLVTGVTAVAGRDRFQRSAHADCVREWIACAGAPVFLTVRATAFSPLTGDALAPAPVTRLAPFPSPAAACSFAPSPPRGPSLERAARVVAGGGGCNGEGFALLARLAARLEAAVGASRAAVEQGLAPEERQIGQTGRIIAPDLYVAAGISGSLQHLAGVKDARCIVAINSDPAAPILAVADYAWVADLHQAIPELLALLGEPLGPRV